MYNNYYNNKLIVNRIKELLDSKNITTKHMLTVLEMGINTLSEFSNGRNISCVNLAKIADYLECSVDYLLGRTKELDINK